MHYQAGSLALKPPPSMMLGSAARFCRYGVWLFDIFGEVRGGMLVLMIVVLARDPVQILVCISVVVLL